MSPENILLRLPEAEEQAVRAIYAELAERAGSPRAARAVGAACAANPLPVVVPCHRVVALSGKLGGYAGGPPIKQQLIDLESGHSEGA